MKKLRFFFLSNDELINIISSTKDIKSIEPLLKKCFEGINKLVYNKDDDIEGMISSENEIVKFSDEIHPRRAFGISK